MQTAKQVEQWRLVKLKEPGLGGAVKKGMPGPDPPPMPTLVEVPHILQHTVNVMQHCV